MKLIITLSTLAILALCSTVKASTLPNFPFVTVSGDSIRKVVPDEAKIHFTLVTFNKNAEQAHATLKTTTSLIIDAMRANQIADKNITSFEINKYVKRAKDTNYNSLEIMGYELNQQFEISLTNLEKFAEISAALTELQNIENIRSQFDYSKRDEIEIELIKEASQQAKLKASHMAAGLGVKLGAIFAFNDSGSYTSFFATFGLNTTSYRVAEMRKPSPQTSNLFIPQYIEIQKTINVIYRIEN